MPIGTRIGTRIGSRVGVRVGSSYTTVFRDGPNNLAFPSAPDQWQAHPSWRIPAFAFELNTATHTDAVLGQTTLTIGGSPTPAQARAGWAVPWLQFTEVNGQGITAPGFVDLATPGELFNLNVQSVVATLEGFRLNALPVGTSILMVLSGAEGYVTVASNGRLALRRNGEVVAGTYDYNDGADHFVRVCYDRTNSVWRLYTDKETIAGTFADIAVDGVKGLGAFNGGFPPPPCYVKRWVIHVGTDAEYLTTNGRADMVARGWTVI